MKIWEVNLCINSDLFFCIKNNFNLSSLVVNLKSSLEILCFSFISIDVPKTNIPKFFDETNLIRIVKLPSSGLC